MEGNEIRILAYDKAKITQRMAQYAIEGCKRNPNIKVINSDGALIIVLARTQDQATTNRMMNAVCKTVCELTKLYNQ